MNLELGSFIVMPNHFHCILIIGENDYNRRDAMRGVSVDSDAMRGVSVISGADVSDAVVSDADALDADALDAKHGVSTNAFKPQSKNVASVIRGFKSAVTTNARKMGNLTFEWQPRFYDHIIRDSDSFNNIQHYIESNAANWGKDKFY